MLHSSQKQSLIGIFKATGRLFASFSMLLILGCDRMVATRGDTSITREDGVRFSSRLLFKMSGNRLALVCVPCGKDARQCALALCCEHRVRLHRKQEL